MSTMTERFVRFRVTWTVLGDDEIVYFAEGVKSDTDSTNTFATRAEAEDFAKQLEKDRRIQNVQVVLFGAAGET